MQLARSVILPVEGVYNSIRGRVLETLAFYFPLVMIL